MAQISAASAASAVSVASKPTSARGKLSAIAGAAALLACALGHAADAPPAATPAATTAATPEPAAHKLDRLAGKAEGVVVYRGATLIDGTGAAPRGDMAIVVDGDTIESIVPAAQLDASPIAGARVYDARGLYVMPGLIDSHVHYATRPDRPYAEAELQRNIYGGVTGVRDMAGDARELASLSRAALLNEIPAPDIFYAALVAGPSFFQDPRTQVAALGMRPGEVPWLYAVTGQTDLSLAIAQARGTGATGLKIYANLPGPLVRKLIAEAKRQHFPVWTHQQVYPATPYDSLGATGVARVHGGALCARSGQGAVRPRRRTVVRRHDGGRSRHRQIRRGAGQVRHHHGRDAERVCAGRPALPAGAGRRHHPRHAPGRREDHRRHRFGRHRRRSLSHPRPRAAKAGAIRGPDAGRGARRRHRQRGDRARQARPVRHAGRGEIGQHGVPQK